MLDYLEYIWQEYPFESGLIFGTAVIIVGIILVMIDPLNVVRWEEFAK